MGKFLMGMVSGGALVAAALAVGSIFFPPTTPSTTAAQPVEPEVAEPEEQPAPEPEAEATDPAPTTEPETKATAEDPSAANPVIEPETETAQPEPEPAPTPEPEAEAVSTPEPEAASQPAKQDANADAKGETGTSPSATEATAQAPEAAPAETVVAGDTPAPATEAADPAPVAEALTAEATPTPEPAAQAETATADQAPEAPAADPAATTPVAPAPEVAAVTQPEVPLPPLALPQLNGDAVLSALDKAADSVPVPEPEAPAAETATTEAPIEAEATETAEAPATEAPTAPDPATEGAETAPEAAPPTADPAPEVAETTPPADTPAPDVTEAPPLVEPAPELAEATPEADPEAPVTDEPAPGMVAIPEDAEIALPGTAAPEMPGSLTEGLPGSDAPEAEVAVVIDPEAAPENTIKPTPGFARKTLGTIIGRDENPEESTETAEAEAVPTDTRPIALFAAPFENPDAKPLLSIVLIDTGAAELDREALANLPFPVSFALDPLDPASPDRAAIYRAAGKEVLMLATGIAEGAQASDIEVAFQSMAQAIPEAVAVMDLPNPAFQNRRPLASLVVPVIGAQGRGLISWDLGLNAADQVARRDGVPTTEIFRNLTAGGEDNAAIRRTLDRAIFLAGQNGRTTVAGEATPEVIGALLEWTIEGRAASVALAPVTAVLN